MTAELPVDASGGDSVEWISSSFSSPITDDGDDDDDAGGSAVELELAGGARYFSSLMTNGTRRLSSLPTEFRRDSKRRRGERICSIALSGGGPKRSP